MQQSTAEVDGTKEYADEASTLSPREAAQRWVDEFHRALTSGDPASTAEVFEPGGFWRDFVSFTWNLYTAEGTAGRSARNRRMRTASRRRG